MEKQRLKRVRVENLEPNTRLTDDILSAKQTVLLRAGTILKRDFIAKLARWGIEHVYTHSDQFVAEREMDDTAEAVLDFFSANKGMFLQRAELQVVLEDKTNHRESFPALDGAFMHNGVRVAMREPATAPPADRRYTASGSIEADRSRARVARANSGRRTTRVCCAHSRNAQSRPGRWRATNPSSSRTRH